MYVNVRRENLSMVFNIFKTQNTNTSIQTLIKQTNGQVKIVYTSLSNLFHCPVLLTRKHMQHCSNDISECQIDIVWHFLDVKICSMF